MRTPSCDIIQSQEWKKNSVKLSVIKIKAKMKLGVRKSRRDTKCSRWCFTLVQTLQVTVRMKAPLQRDETALRETSLESVITVTATSLKKL